MNAKFSFLSLLLIVLFSTQISLANETTAMLARKAVSPDSAESLAAIDELRTLGPSGVDALMAEHAHEINRHVDFPLLASSPEWQRITQALDLVGQQKNNFISGLYWYTDIEEAKKAARESGRPILSLRLLGNLTDELSCANSRFFRTVLYANAQIRETLHDRFVLHWKSVRPAPRITVDFGDGRKIESTITGNSIHYILDSDGQLIEALPGLYDPVTFQRNLRDAQTLFNSLQGKTPKERNVLLSTYYGDRINKISLAWQEDIKQFGDRVPERLRMLPQERDALSVGPAAITKMAVERPMARAITSASDALGRLTDEQAWRLIAARHSLDWILDQRSVSLIQRQNPSLQQNDMNRLVQRFRESIRLDTVRNEYMLHPTLYGWMTKEALRADLEKLNDRIYEQLFLTPSSDAWLGLLSPEIYTAIENGGVIKGQ
jgi:hypothetical protein